MVDYSTNDGTAHGGGFCVNDFPDDDYITTSGQLTFSPGNTSQTFTVEICDDFVENEPDKTINLRLSNARNASLGTSSATLVIVNDDIIPLVEFSSATYSVNEYNGPTTITVNLDRTSTQPITVNYTTNGGTAIGDTGCAIPPDYVESNGMLLFPPGTTSRTFTVDICDDTSNEGDETVGLELSSPSNASLGTQQTAILTIIDTNPPSAIDDTSSTAEDVFIIIDVLDNDSDPDGDPLTVTSVSTPVSGTATINPNYSVTYTPDPDFNGNDTFTYSVSDGIYTDTASVIVTIVPVNDPPVAVDDYYSTTVGSPITISLPGVLGNDIDVDDTIFTVELSSVSTPTGGSVTPSADGSFTYTPPLATGVFTFTYQATDGNLPLSNVATVFITVDPG